MQPQRTTPTLSDADPFVIAGNTYPSRLLVGTGKYGSNAAAKQAIIASGADLVTLAVRRLELASPVERITDYLDAERFTYLPNSSGCYTAKEAVRILRLAREAGGFNLVKLEVVGNKETLYPDMIETLSAAETLVDDGFDVMAYCTDDPNMALRLEEIGCVAIMPLAAPIGSGLGILNPLYIQLIVEQATVPVLIDAGIGTASDAAMAMELGCDGVLLNTAIAEARDPVRMAQAFKLAVQAGRQAYLAGRMPKRGSASASSPLTGLSS
ncbi:MAG: thiazole synthase [Rickettsiales bacterium]|nr:thiazole synthase [Rickettsiales bacterium]